MTRPPGADASNKTPGKRGRPDLVRRKPRTGSRTGRDPLPEHPAASGSLDHDGRFPRPSDIEHLLHLRNRVDHAGLAQCQWIVPEVVPRPWIDLLWQ